MVTILLTFIAVLAFSGVSLGKSSTEFFGKALTEQQLKFLKDRAEVLEEVESVRKAELRLWQDIKFCKNVAGETTDHQKVFDDCRRDVIDPISQFYKKWGKTEKEGLLLQHIDTILKE